MWGFDLVVAITIFLIGVIAAYIYAINFLNESQETLDDLFYGGNLVSGLILSEGTPVNWDTENVEIPGILTNKQINQSKLENFYILAENYPNLKNLLNTKYQFYFNFTNIKIQGESIPGMGKPIENPQNLIQIERFTIYEDKPVKFTLFMWN